MPGGGGLVWMGLDKFLVVYIEGEGGEVGSGWVIGKYVRRIHEGRETFHACLQTDSFRARHCGGFDMLL